MTQAKINKALSPLIVSIDTLHEDPDNARGHDERNIEAIKSSLLAFGQQKPIVVDSTGKILAGNGTFAAASLLGWKNIAATVTDLKSEDQKKSYAIADNRTAELAEWNFEALAASLGDISEEFKLHTGFSETEINSITALNWTPPEATDEEEPKLPDNEKEETFTVKFNMDQWSVLLRMQDCHPKKTEMANLIVMAAHKFIDEEDQ